MSLAGPTGHIDNLADQIIQMILDTPMRKWKLDKGSIWKEWPTNDGKPWVEPDSKGGMEGLGFMQ